MSQAFPALYKSLLNFAHHPGLLILTSLGTCRSSVYGLVADHLSDMQLGVSANLRDDSYGQI